MRAMKPANPRPENPKMLSLPAMIAATKRYDFSRLNPGHVVPSQYAGTRNTKTGEAASDFGIVIEVNHETGFATVSTGGGCIEFHSLSGEGRVHKSASMPRTFALAAGL